MAISRKEVRPDRLPGAVPPIKYLTENGFSLVRLSEIDASVADKPIERRFLVQYEDEPEREIRVGFNGTLAATLRLRRRIPLSDASKFWVVCAESCLAKYLWEQNDFPPNGQLIVNEFSPDELMLALHWRDTE